MKGHQLEITPEEVAAVLTRHSTSAFVLTKLLFAFMGKVAKKHKQRNSPFILTAPIVRDIRA